LEKVEQKKSLIIFVVTKTGKVELGKCPNCKFEDSVKIDKVFKGMPDFKKPAFVRGKAIDYPIKMFVKK